MCNRTSALWHKQKQGEGTIPGLPQCISSSSGGDRCQQAWIRMDWGGSEVDGYQALDSNASSFPMISPLSIANGTSNQCICPYSSKFRFWGISLMIWSCPIEALEVWKTRRWFKLGSYIPHTVLHEIHCPNLRFILSCICAVFMT